MRSAHVEYTTLSQTAFHCQYVCYYATAALKPLPANRCKLSSSERSCISLEAWSHLLSVCLQAPHANGFQQRTLSDIILQKIQDKERAQGQASTSGYAPLHCIHSSLNMHHCHRIQANPKYTLLQPVSGKPYICITVNSYATHCKSRVYSSESRVSRCDLKGTEL